MEAVTEAARARRNRCGIPENEGHRPKWMLAVEMLDELAEHGLRPPVLVADAGYGDNSQFRAALDERNIAYNVQLKSEALAHTSEAAPSRGNGPARADAAGHRPPRPSIPTNRSAWPGTWPPPAVRPRSPSPGAKAAKAP